MRTNKYHNIMAVHKAPLSCLQQVMISLFWFSSQTENASLYIIMLPSQVFAALTPVQQLLGKGHGSRHEQRLSPRDADSDWVSVAQLANSNVHSAVSNAVCAPVLGAWRHD